LSESTPAADSIAAQRDALVNRLFDGFLGTLDLASVYLGDRLGFYRALAVVESSTAADLAARTGTHPRYVREWLEQQAATGILETTDASLSPDARRFRLPEGHREVLLDRDSLNHLAPLSRFVACIGVTLPRVVDAFRTGGGVSWADYGPDAREGQADFNRPIFQAFLGKEWLPSIPDVHARLTADPPARVADIGCGAGWSGIAIAQSYSKAQVDGFDLDEPSIALAQANAQAAGLANRVHFRVQDASDPAFAGRYDLVTAFECIHDLPNPVEVLGAMRRLATDDGAVIVMDERVGEEFTAPADAVERLFYGFSVLC
jgi:hypothetical protein